MLGDLLQDLRYGLRLAASQAGSVRYKGNPDMLKLIVRYGLKLTLMGGLPGMAGSVALSRVLASLLFGVSAIDPSTIAAGATLPLLVALLACYQRARRATRVDPMAALRSE